MLRFFDVVFSLLGLTFGSPVLLVIYLVGLFDTGSPLFRQERVGRNQKPFILVKFRTMRVGTASVASHLADVQAITPMGQFLRRTKLDELPQLWNVLWGDMSLVGPRPEVPKYVAHYPESVKDIVLSVRPGITDWASIRMIDENEILGKAADPERAYIEQVLPEKLGYYVRYAQSHSLAGDVQIIVATLLKIVTR